MRMSESERVRGTERCREECNRPEDAGERHRDERDEREREKKEKKEKRKKVKSEKVRFS